MPKFAVINSSNMVTNVVVADTEQDAVSATGETCVEITNLGGIGWTWDGTNFVHPENTSEATPLVGPIV